MSGTRAKATSKMVAYRRVRVSVTAGPDAGQNLEVAGRIVRIGSNTENDLVLSDDTVSGHHCSIEPTSQGLVVRDEGSTNGVISSGARVYHALFTTTPVVMQLGDSTISVAPIEGTVTRERLDVAKFGDLVGQSGVMQELFADLNRCSPSEVSVLIEGETGTGKELVAEALHTNSGRAAGPFVVFDCSAVAPNLVESELFGHVKGAFTGASDNRIGVFQQAHGGTIFLDELGELPKDLQPKLLRVLEKREVRRLGAARAAAIDVRLVSATNRNLVAEVRRGNFREDLYYRVAGAHVLLPPLRNRMEDLPLLTAHFLALQPQPRSLDEIPQHIWALFQSYRWPGNVRELKNAVQRLLIMPDRPLPQFQDGERQPITQATKAAAHADERLLPLREARREAADSFEQDYLRQVLERTQNNVTRAAAIAEVSRQMVQRLMRKHGL